MKAIIQRVDSASVCIEYKKTNKIGKGLMVLIGVAPEDNQGDIDWICRKISNMRIFSDADGKMNLSVKDINGEILVVSQFTLFASTKKGNRPSFDSSATPAEAIPLYEKFVSDLSKEINKSIPTGEFGAHMDVSIQNNGPITIILDSRDRK